MVDRRVTRVRDLKMEVVAQPMAGADRLFSTVGRDVIPYSEHVPNGSVLLSHDGTYR